MQDADGDPGIGAGEIEALRRSLAGLEAAAGSFGTTLTRGLRAAVVEGRSLEGVLKGAMLQLSGQALEAALSPLSGLLNQLASRLAGGFGGVLAGLVGGAAPASAGAAMPEGRTAGRGEGGVTVTVNVTTPDAESFRRSEAQITGMLARAVGRGRRGL